MPPGKKSIGWTTRCSGYEWFVPCMLWWSAWVVTSVIGDMITRIVQKINSDRPWCRGVSAILRRATGHQSLRQMSQIVSSSDDELVEVTMTRILKSHVRGKPVLSTAEGMLTCLRRISWPLSWALRLRSGQACRRD